MQTTTKWIKQLRLGLSLVVGSLRRSRRLVSQLHIELESFASNCNVKKNSTDTHSEKKGMWFSSIPPHIVGPISNQQKKLLFQTFKMI